MPVRLGGRSNFDETLEVVDSEGDMGLGLQGNFNWGYTTIDE